VESFNVLATPAASTIARSAQSASGFFVGTSRLPPPPHCPKCFALTDVAATSGAARVPGCFE
jgi:hypothetical protein